MYPKSPGISQSVVFVESVDESTLNKTLWIFEITMFSGSSGSSASSGSNPSPVRSMCSEIAQIRRAHILGVFTCQIDRGVNQGKHTNSASLKRKDERALTAWNYAVLVI
jgi:hypothetical protein